MPEMPEVETVRRTLKPHVVGQRVVGVDVALPRLLKYGLTPEELAATIVGHTIADLQRRAKYLRFVLAGSERVLVAHLGMTGVLMFATEPPPSLTHVRAVIALAEGALYFDDVRTFGKLYLSPADEPTRLGPEPLSDGFTPARLAQICRGRRAKVKSLLLDQRQLAGLGNIYADEALFAAGINPERVAATLTADEVSRLHQAVNDVIAAGIADGGTTVSDYRDGNGHGGMHQEHLRVYQRTGAPCPVCGAPIARAVIGSRSSHFCPRCQK